MPPRRRITTVAGCTARRRRRPTFSQIDPPPGPARNAGSSPAPPRRRTVTGTTAARPRRRRDEACPAHLATRTREAASRRQANADREAEQVGAASRRGSRRGERDEERGAAGAAARQVHLLLVGHPVALLQVARRARGDDVLPDRVAPSARGTTWSSVSFPLDPQYWQRQPSRAKSARREILRSTPSAPGRRKSRIDVRPANSCRPPSGAAASLPARSPPPCP